jgi:hypothetical protein
MLAAPAPASSIIRGKRTNRLRKVAEQPLIADLGIVELGCEERARHDSPVES